MIGLPNKLFLVSKRSRNSTKRKLLEAILHNYRKHVMTTLFFLDAAEKQYDDISAGKSLITEDKYPPLIDFNATPVMVRLQPLKFFCTAETKRWLCDDLFDHGLGVYLVWCFEELEEFFKNIYAFVGLCNENYWQQGDFAKNAKHNTFKDYRTAVKKNRSLRNYKDILTRLRKIFSQIEEFEKKGEVYFDWDVAYTAQMRHHIVHAACAVEDTNKFNQKIRDALGLNGNSDFEKYLSDMGKRYLTPDRNSTTSSVFYIHLFDASNKQHKVEPCSKAVLNLFAYAQLIKTAIDNSFFAKESTVEIS